MKRGNSSMIIEEYNKEIDEALEEVAVGSYITQIEMERRADKW